MIKLMFILEATLGGIRKHVNDLLVGLDKDEFDITLVYSAQRSDEIFDRSLGELSRIGIRLAEVPMCREISPLQDMKCLSLLLGVVKSTQPDIMHLHGAKAGALGRLAAIMTGVKHVVYTPHGGAFHKFAGLKGRLYLSIEKILKCPSNHFIGVSKDSCRQIEHFLKPPRENVHLIYNGIDIEAVDHRRCLPMSSREQLGIKTDRFVVLFPAVFLEAKGHLEFIAAIERSGIDLNPDVLIILAGDGPLCEQIVAGINKIDMSDHFKLVGFQPDLADYYSVSDLVILPSQSEAFGYVLLEAMAYGTPVLATMVGGMPEVVVNGYNGELFPVDKLHLMLERINYYSHNNRALSILGANARAFVESRFSKRTMVEATSFLYKKIHGTI